MEIGDKIRYLRRKSNMNQTELAQKLGVVTSTVGFWETGRRQPDLDAIVKKHRQSYELFLNSIHISKKNKVQNEKE